MLSDSADVYYKCTTLYDPRSNTGVRWDDPDISIDWPLANGVTPILSEADATAPPLSATSCFA